MGTLKWALSKDYVSTWELDDRERQSIIMQVTIIVGDYFNTITKYRQLPCHTFLLFDIIKKNDGLRIRDLLGKYYRIRFKK